MRTKNLIFILLTIVACKAYQPTIPQSDDEVVDENRPDWVVRKPVSDEHYIGIGNSLLADLDYQMNAKLEALDDLSSEISVTVESNSLLYQIENSVGVNEQFESAIKSTTKQTLELHEQVASWSDDKSYWVQYRISKLAFEELKKSRKATATSIAERHFANAKTAEENGNIVQCIHFYAQSIEALGGYLNEVNTILIGNSFVDIPIEAYAKIISILSGVKLTSEALSYQLLPGETSKKVVIKALTKNGKPIQGLHVKYNELEKKVTNQDGEVHVGINTKSTLKTLALETDYEFLKRYPITYVLTKDIPPAQIDIGFDVPTIKMSISSIEQNLDKRMSRLLVSPVVKEILTEKGYSVVDNDEDYMVEIHSNTRKGGEISGLFTSYLDITIDIKNASGSSIYSDSFSRIKGIHTSYQAAGVKAYQNAEQQLKDRLQDSLTKNFINKD